MRSLSAKLGSSHFRLCVRSNLSVNSVRDTAHRRPHRGERDSCEPGLFLRIPRGGTCGLRFGWWCGRGDVGDMAERWMDRPHTSRYVSHLTFSCTGRVWICARRRALTPAPPRRAPPKDPQQAALGEELSARTIHGEQKIEMFYHGPLEIMTSNHPFGVRTTGDTGIVDHMFTMKPPGLRSMATGLYFPVIPSSNFRRRGPLLLVAEVVVYAASEGDPSPVVT